MNDRDEVPSPADMFREFAMACRVERDRIALARLAAEDRRFASSMHERTVADGLALQVIRTAAQR